MKNTGIAIVSLVSGLVIGSALTMLFAPQSGADFRKQIKDFIDEEVDKVKATMEKLHEKGVCDCEK